MQNLRIGGAALALAAVAAFTAACGSSSPSSGANAPASAEASGGNDYVSCLRRNGVNLPQFNPSNRPTLRPTARPSGFPTVRPSGQPRPSGSFRGGFRGGAGGFFGSVAPSGVDQDTWNKAQQACASLRPTAFPGGGGGNGRDAAYRNCLTDHGITVNGPADRLDPSDPKVAAAMQACAPLRPSPAAS